MHLPTMLLTPVSIPYKRVTNLFLSPWPTWFGSVSIPYKRVTNIKSILGPSCGYEVSIPYKRVTNPPSQSHTAAGSWFQSPISGSQTGFDEEEIEALISFNPL